jgi:RNA polymerase sigma-70 factor (ECF subfamily)
VRSEKGDGDDSVQPIDPLGRVVVVVTVPADRAEAVVSASADEAADSFDAYFRTSKQPLVSMAYLLTGDMQTAQDLTQEALLRTWSRWKRISRYDDPRAWTRRVLYNLAVSQSRRNKTRRHAAVLQRAVPAPDESHLLLATALRALPENQMRALVLHDGAGMSVKEVAIEMGVAEGTVKSWLSRGRSAAASALTSSTHLAKGEA